jgi:hypothetical protein
MLTLMAVLYVVGCFAVTIGLSRRLARERERIEALTALVGDDPVLTEDDVRAIERTGFYAERVA